MSSEQQQDILKTFKSQLVPVLLTIIGFFLVQTNNKIDTAIEKIDTFAVAQAGISQRVYELEKDHATVVRQLDKMNSDIADFYEEYGYLFTDEAKIRLTK